MSESASASVIERLRAYRGNPVSSYPLPLCAEAADLLEEAVKVLEDHQKWALTFSFQEYEGSQHEENLKNLQKT